MTEDSSGPTRLTDLSYEPLTAKVGKDVVEAYRAGCVVPGYDESTGFDEQKAKLVRRSGAGKVFGFVFGILCTLLGVLLVFGGLVVLLTGTGSTTGSVVAIIAGVLLTWAGIASIRSAGRQPINIASWERHYRLNAFAQANRMTYVFRSDPKRWPGLLSTVPRRSGGHFSDVSKIEDVLRGADAQGQRFMACQMELTHCRGAITGRDIYSNYYTVVALQLTTTTKQVYLKHRHRVDLEAADLLQANYKLDDPYGPWGQPAMTTSSTTARDRCSPRRCSH